MSVTYRRMTLADAEAVHAIEVETFPEPWSLQSFQEEMTRNACARYIVAEEDGAVLGYAGAWLILDEGHITNVAVTKSRRGEGIGEALMRALMQYAANMGVQYMTLEVRRLCTASCILSSWACASATTRTTARMRFCTSVRKCRKRKKILRKKNKRKPRTGGAFLIAPDLL